MPASENGCGTLSFRLRYAPPPCNKYESQGLANAKFISTVQNRCLFDIKQTLHCHMQPQTISILYNTMQHSDIHPSRFSNGSLVLKWLSHSQRKSTIYRFPQDLIPLYTHYCVLAILGRTQSSCSLVKTCGKCQLDGHCRATYRRPGMAWTYLLAQCASFRYHTHCTQGFTELQKR